MTDFNKINIALVSIQHCFQQVLICFLQSGIKWMMLNTGVKGVWNYLNLSTFKQRLYLWS